MRRADTFKALDAVGQKWTKQRKAEERSRRARTRRDDIWKPRRTSLVEICWENMERAWLLASGNDTLPTHWRQIFYKMRPICERDGRADRPLKDSRFYGILGDYLEHVEPPWASLVLRGARGVFKEPHRLLQLPMSTAGVRGYLSERAPDARLERFTSSFPTHGAENRFGAVLICEKEGFDDTLMAARLPQRYDVALMSTKGVSAFAARDLARDVGVPCFMLHDFDKAGFTIAAGFPFATDIGIRMADVEDERWALRAESQEHGNQELAYHNLRGNGATDEEAAFIAHDGKRVELNEFSSFDLVAFIESKLEQHGVEKVVPDVETLAEAWKRAHAAIRVNRLIESTWSEGASPDVDLAAAIPPAPDDLADRVREAFDKDDSHSWDEALWDIAEDGGAE